MSFPIYLTEAARSQAERRRKEPNIQYQPRPGVERLLRWRKAHLYDRMDPTAPNFKPGKTMEQKISYIEWLYQYLIFQSWRLHPKWNNSHPFMREYGLGCFEPEKIPWRWKDTGWWDPWYWSNGTKPYQIEAKPVGARFRPGMDVVSPRRYEFGWAWGPERAIVLERDQRVTVTAVKVLADGHHMLETTLNPGGWIDAERWGFIPACEVD